MDLQKQSSSQIPSNLYPVPMLKYMSNFHIIEKADTANRESLRYAASSSKYCNGHLLARLSIGCNRHDLETSMPAEEKMLLNSQMMIDSRTSYPTPAQYKLRVPGHEHSGCPDSLSCLQGSNGKALDPIPVIIRCAILGSFMKRLTISELYGTLEDKYPWYRNIGR